MYRLLSSNYRLYVCKVSSHVIHIFVQSNVKCGRYIMRKRKYSYYNIILPQNACNTSTSDCWLTQEHTLVIPSRQSWILPFKYSAVVEQKLGSNCINMNMYILSHLTNATDSANYTEKQKKRLFASQRGLPLISM